MPVVGANLDSPNPSCEGSLDTEVVETSENDRDRSEVYPLLTPRIVFHNSSENSKGYQKMHSRQLEYSKYYTASIMEQLENTEEKADEIEFNAEASIMEQLENTEEKADEIEFNAEGH
ncbi:hypothetical protein ScPMuIL_000853 [Solemya velum]